MLDMIVLTDMHWGIGQNGDLLTRIPEDMRFFKKITMNKPVIMGRKTRDSLPKGYLDKRSNIILSRSFTANTIHTIPNVNFDSDTQITEYPSIEMFLSDLSYYTNKPVVIGGAQIYKEFLDRKLIDRIYLTIVNKIYEADTFIPDLYKYGFRYDPTHPLNVETGYEEEHISENGKDKFSIRTLIKN